jgi:deglycase
MATTLSTFQALLGTESSAALLRLSTAQLLDAPENSALKQSWVEPPTNPSEFAGKKIAVISTDGLDQKGSAIVILNVGNGAVLNEPP